MKTNSRKRDSGFRKRTCSRTFVNFSTLGFGLSKLKEQTGNVDENKGQGQKVEESVLRCQESEVRPTTEG